MLCRGIVHIFIVQMFSRFLTQPFHINQMFWLGCLLNSDNHHVESIYKFPKSIRINVRRPPFYNKFKANIEPFVNDPYSSPFNELFVLFFRISYITYWQQKRFGFVLNDFEGSNIFARVKLQSILRHIPQASSICFISKTFFNF